MARQNKGRGKGDRRGERGESGRGWRGKRLQLDDFPDLVYVATQMLVPYQGRQIDTSRNREDGGTTTLHDKYGPVLA